MLVHFADMRADLFKALLADDVLNAAGVLCCNVLRHAEIGAVSYTHLDRLRLRFVLLVRRHARPCDEPARAAL